MQIKKRVLYFDFLNILATFSVISMHCNGGFHEYTPTRIWAQSMAVEVICYWAVPIFFMLSGATLMDYRKKYNTKEFFKKRFLRIVVPFLAFSVISFLYFGMLNDTLNEGFATEAHQLLLSISHANAQGVYWFFIPLLSMYLTLPVLSLLTEKKHRKTLWYFVGASFFFNALIPYLDINMSGGWTFPLNGTGYIMYVVLGYLLSTADIKKSVRYSVYALGIGSAVFRYVGTYILSKRDGATNLSLSSYTSFLTVFLAAAVFLAFKYIPKGKMEEKPKIVHAVSHISSCSFGIYLIHMIVITFILDVTQIDSASAFWRYGGSLVIYFVSLAIVMILKKIPFVKAILP